MRRTSKPLIKQVRGFTLVELIVVMVITGILAAGGVLFIRNPLQSYLDTETRAALTDLADGALRRISRGIERALPNSVRVAGTCNGTSDCMVEYVAIQNAGRYRAEVGTLNPLYLPHSAADPLDFAANTDTFDVLGPSIGGVNTATDQLVIFNLGVPGADVYEGSNRRAITSVTTDATWTETKIGFTGSSPFPFQSPGSRFYIVRTPTSFACDMTNKKLLRYDGYAFQASQPASIAALATTTGSWNTTLLADKLSYCKITYANTNQRNSILSIALAFTNNGANVRLMHQVRVINSP